MIKLRYFYFVLVLFFIMVNFNIVWADPAKVSARKTPDTTAAVEIIKKVGSIQEIQEQLNVILQRYDDKKDECVIASDEDGKAICLEELRKLLESAKALLQKLREQAQSVESEILITREKVADIDLDKLDRILNEVIAIRETSTRQLNTRTL